MPQDYDQFDNAVRAELFQIGLVSRKKTDSEVLRLFNELVSREDWSHLKALAQTKQSLPANKDSLSRNRETLESEVIEGSGGRDFYLLSSIDLLLNEHKKLEHYALVFWLLMGDVLSPRDEIFFLV